MVTLLLPFWSAYLIAILATLCVLYLLMGFTPIPASSSISTFNSLLRKSLSLTASGLSHLHSIPLYKSSVFSLTIIKSTLSGFRRGDSSPFMYFTGLMLAYASSISLIVTLRDLNPPPTGVSRGPFNTTLYLCIKSIDSWGNLFPTAFSAFSPTIASIHFTCLEDL